MAAWLPPLFGRLWRAGFRLARRPVAAAQQERLRRALLRGAAPAADGAARVALLAVSTRDQPEALERALASFAANLVDHGRRAELAVLDDSGAEAGRRNRDTLLRIGERFGLACAYAGRDEKRRYLEALAAAAGVPAPVPAFALWPGAAATPGTGRNAALLHGAGDCVVVVDDSMVCDLGAPPAARDGLRITDQRDARRLWLAAGAEPARPDFLARHERLLGRSLADCLRGVPPRDVDLTDVDQAFVERGRSAGLVALTSGGRAPAAFLDYLGGHILYDAAGRVAHGVSRHTISPTTDETGADLGLDNRRLLPPFLPLAGRGDAVYGRLVERCWPGALQGHVPTVSSLQSAPAARERLVAEAAGVTASDLLARFLDADPARLGLAAVADSLQEFARLDADQLAAEVRLLGREVVAAQLARLEPHCLGDAPWNQDARAVYAAQRRFLVETTTPVPAELGDLEGLRGFLGRCADLLRHWPALVGAARRLRASGVRLAVSP